MGHGRYYEGSGQAVGGMQNRVAYARRLRFDQDFARPLSIGAAAYVGRLPERPD